MENLKQLPFEQKSIFHIDPRTKIFLTITVTTIMCAGKFAQGSPISKKYTGR